MHRKELTKTEKITAILEMLGVHDDHYTHVRESLDLLSDEAIHRQHAHCVVVKDLLSEEATVEDEADAD